VLLRSMLTCILLFVTIGLARPASESARPADVPPMLYTVAKSYEPLAWLHGNERFSADAAVVLSDQSGRRAFAPDFAESADPAISFDAQRVLFAAKLHPADPWQIWEKPIREGKPRRITSCNEDCIRPFYLPDDRVVYARKIAARFIIEIADLSGGKPLALTYISANALPTDVLRDGRILFESGYPLGTNGNPEIYTVYSDGSGVESYRCDHGSARHTAKQSRSGDIVFASSHGVGRFTSARAKEVVTPAPTGEYAGDFAEASDAWFVSWRPDPNQPFRLMRWTPGSKELRQVFGAADASVVEPVIIAPHAVPNRHPSGLHDWPNANLLCLNAYTSKYSFAAGSIHSVRMYTRDSTGNPKLLGSAPVERDGSFFVQVPDDQPLQIELLDASGKTLKREAGYFWMRRGEQRGCVGCHAGPETAPEYAVPMILLKSTIPSDLTGSTQSAAGGH